MGEFIYTSVYLSNLLFGFIQLIFWLLFFIGGTLWLFQRLFPKIKTPARILRKIISLIFFAPLKTLYEAIKWLIIKIFTTQPQYRLRETYLENYPVTPLQFYQAIEDAFRRRQIAGAQILRVTRREWHLLSGRRIYVLIRFRKAACFIGAVPLGTGVLISWRYAEMPYKFWLILFQMPFLGVIAERLLMPPTFYRADIHRAFEQAVRTIVLEATRLIAELDTRELTEAETRPLLRDFYG